MNQNHTKRLRKGLTPALAAFGLMAMAGTARAQTTNISLQAQPSATTLRPGDALSIIFSLKVASIAPNTARPEGTDVYNSASLFFAYATSQAGGAAPASPFSSLSVTPTQNGTPQNSIFNTVTLSRPAQSVSSATTQYLGLAVRQAATTNHNDVGTFQLATANATLRSDLAPGDYTFNFVDLGSGLGRTFVFGQFGTANDYNPRTGLNVNAVTIHVAAVPESSLVAGMGLGGAMLSGGLLFRRRKRANESERKRPAENGTV